MKKAVVWVLNHLFLLIYGSVFLFFLAAMGTTALPGVFARSDMENLCQEATQVSDVETLEVQALHLGFKLLHPATWVRDSLKKEPEVETVITGPGMFYQPICRVTVTREKIVDARFYVSTWN